MLSTIDRICHPQGGALLDASHLLDGAKKAQKAGRLDEARRLCGQALVIDSHCLEAVLMLAGLLQEQGDFDGAINLANHAIELEPGLFNGYSILGYCHLAKKQPALAADCLAKAISLEPTVAILHHLLARALQQLDRDDEAVEAYRRAIHLAPHVVEPHIVLGQLYLKLGNRTDAVSSFRRAYRLEPNSVRGLTQLAKVLTEEGKFDEAEASLRTAVSLDPNSAVPRAMLGEALSQQGKFNEASVALHQAISLQPEMARPYLHLVQCRKLSASDNSLIERMESLLAEPSRTPDDCRYLSYALGKARNDLGEFEAAMRHFDEANRIMLGLARPPFNREAHAAQFEFAIQNLTREFLDRNSSVGNESEAPVFIVGMIRSGTTLVEQILSSHPDVGGGGELKFWLEHTKNVVDGTAIDTAKLPGVSGRYLNLLNRLAPGKTRVTDKMPLNFMFLGVIHLAFPRARIIHCRRNPLDNCLSIYHTPFSDPVNYAHSKENIVYWYEDYLRLMEHWRTVLPADRLLEVDYEGLVLDRERMTRMVVDFIGMDWSDACLQPESNQRTVRTPSMWQVRQPVYRTSIERWRNYEPWLGEFCRLSGVSHPVPGWHGRNGG